MAANAQAIAASLPVTSDERGFWKRYFAPPDPGQPSRVWHTSPAIDMAGYHFSWVWLLIPFLFGDSDDLAFYVYAIMMGVTLAHRHYGLPYAYLDDSVFSRFRNQLTWFPLVCIALFAATPFLLMREAEGSVLAKTVGVIVFFSFLWNIWHTYMQKFGILRLYLAKEPNAPLKTPGWVDKYFLFCWIPLYLSYLAPAYKDVILDRGSDIGDFLSAIIAFMEKYETMLVLPSALIAAGGVGLWLWYEWRTHRLRNRARLSAGCGTTLVSTALFWTNPVNAFVAFAFSHAIEYMVFVWAFQRRFYHRPQTTSSTMQRLLRHPLAWYGCFTALFFAAGFIQVLWGEKIFTNVNPASFLGLTGAKWFFYYAVYESLIHFRMDGFLWKMRSPEVARYV